MAAMRPECPDMDFSKLLLRDVSISARGAKTAAVAQENGERILFNLSEEPLVSPFGACSFGDEQLTRRTIEWSLSPEQVEFWQTFDDWAVAYIAKHSERLFKKTMTRDQVLSGYKSPVTTKEGGQYAPHLRTKINLAGAATCRFWNEENVRNELVSELRGIPCIPRVQISHMWAMSKEFGFVINITDLKTLQQPEDCPF